MISGTSWIGSSYEVVYLSAVILLFVMHVNTKNGHHNHKAIVAANIDAHAYACSIRASVFKHVSTLHVYYAQMYAALLT